MKYAWIDEHCDQYTVSRLCRVLQVSRSGYCQWRVRPPSAGTLANQALDAKVAAISAASIVAKVHRDRWCVQVDEQYPQYGFSGHKGYGTAVHMAALREHGACIHHRRSFAPVAKVLV